MARPDEVPHGHLCGKVYRLLTDHPMAMRFTGRHTEDGPEFEPHPYRAGQFVKVVMVSRFGDCGITDKLDAEYGYDVRVEPNELEPVPMARA